MKIVSPYRFEGYGYSWNLNILNGPKFTIQCGNCYIHFEQRLPRVDYPIIPCPNCGNGNKIPIVYK